MSRILLILFFLTLGATTTFAQTRTVETRTEVDSVTGQRRTVSSETVTSSEDITPRSNMIVINPLKFILYYNLNYYHRLSNSMVIGGGVQIPTIAVDGFGVNAEMRLHPSAKAMRGFYIAPNISYNSLSTDYDTYDFETDEVRNEEASTSAISVGALLGWQWFPGDDFAMGLGIGIDYYFLASSYKDNDGEDPFSSFNGLAPALRFDIGYAW